MLVVHLCLVVAGDAEQAVKIPADFPSSFNIGRHLGSWVIGILLRMRLSRFVIVVNSKDLLTQPGETFPCEHIGLPGLNVGA